MREAPQAPENLEDLAGDLEDPAGDDHGEQDARHEQSLARQSRQPQDLLEDVRLPLVLLVLLVLVASAELPCCR